MPACTLAAMLALACCGDGSATSPATTSTSTTTAAGSRELGGEKTLEVKADSMAPTIKAGDGVAFRFGGAEPKRGDIALYQPAASDPKVPNYVHRVVGLPGERLESRAGLVWINGEPLSEPYLAPGVKTLGFTSVTLPIDSYWLMGDNRDRAADSRVYGPIPRSRIYGLATKIDSPPSRRRPLP